MITNREMNQILYALMASDQYKVNGDLFIPLKATINILKSHLADGVTVDLRFEEGPTGLMAKWDIMPRQSFPAQTSEPESPQKERPAESPAPDAGSKR